MVNSRVVLVVAAGLGACSTSSDVVKVYEKADRAAAPFSKILVVGVHDDAAIRRDFEDALAGALVGTGTPAASSLATMGADRALSADTLATAAQETNSDGVLITRLVDSQVRVEVEGGRATAEAQRRNDITMVDFFRYDYVEYQDPMTVTTVRTVITASDLYAVNDRSKVWSVESTAFEKETAREIIDDISAAIVRQLERDGLTR
jgi:hypothetical protein